MFESDEIETPDGPLTITPIHHASLVLRWRNEAIYCDPVGGATRYGALERPTIIILTHHHRDHFDVETLAALTGEETALVVPQVVFDQLPAQLAQKAIVMANGEEIEINSIGLKAVAMYNTTPERQKFHEEGVGNGYLFDFGGTTLYLASDTEPTPEMDTLGPVDIAFFPMNLPYTMTPDQVVTAIAKVRPKIAYPFHYRYPFDVIGTEPADLQAIMPKDSETEVRARNWYPDL